MTEQIDQKDRFANLATRYRAKIRESKPKLPPPHEVVEQGLRCLSGQIPSHSEDFNVSDLLDDLINREMRGEWTREVGVYHPSSVSPSTCKRALYYDRTSLIPQPQHDSATQAIFDEGHGTHHIIQKRLSQHEGFVDECQIRIEELHVAGSTDGKFRNEDWILEIKSIGDSSFLSLSKPKVEHVWQLHLYMYALDTPRAQLLYVNRNNGSKKLFKIQFSKEIWDEIVSLIQEVEGHVERQEPPDRIDSMYVCRQCKFQYHCRPK